MEVTALPPEIAVKQVKDSIDAHHLGLHHRPYGRGRPRTWVALKTLRAIKKQAEIMDEHRVSLEQLATAAQENAAAAKASADAAFLNAKAVLNTERPWIVVKPRKSSANVFTFEAVNQGRTPAQIIAQSFRWVVALSEVDLEEKSPEYSRAILAYPKFLVPSGVPQDCAYWDVELILQNIPEEQEVRGGMRRIVGYGRVQYYDFLNRTEPPHETRYCYWWNPTDEELMVGGPDGYNLYT